jgi:hypothetical protein
MGSSRSALIISNWTLGNSRSPLFQKPQRLKLVTLCFGANDASINRRDTSWRMVPEAEYRYVRTDDRRLGLGFGLGLGWHKSLVSVLRCQRRLTGNHHHHHHHYHHHHHHHHCSYQQSNFKLGEDTHALTHRSRYDLVVCCTGPTC